ncbi:MAG: GerAB/ArcD/ProY family transporter, partial [Tumebacillaceae bacterium]
MEKPSITTLQAVFMLSGSTGLLNHVLIIPMILQEIGRDSWVSVLVSAGVALLWIPVLYLIVKKTSQQHLLDWIGQRYGRFVAKLLAVLFVTYMMFVSVVTFKDTLNWANTSYLPQTPQVVLIVLFAAICFYNAFSGIGSIAMTASVLIPLVIVLGFFVMTG